MSVGVSYDMLTRKDKSAEGKHHHASFLLSALACLVTSLHKISSRCENYRTLLSMYSLCHPLLRQKFCHSSYSSCHTGEKRVFLSNFYHFLLQLLNLYIFFFNCMLAASSLLSLLFLDGAAVCGAPALVFLIPWQYSGG